MKFRIINRYDPGLKLWRGLRFTFAGGHRQVTIGLTPKLFQFHTEWAGWILSIAGVRIHSKRSGGGVFADWSPIPSR